MGTEFFLLAAFVLVIGVLGKRASVRTYAVIAGAAFLAAVVIYRS